MYNIATGKSRSARKWAQVKLTFDELVNKLKDPIRTQETVAEYKKMRKAQRDEVKDVGGFVGGVLRDGIRKNENVISRSIITLDVDGASPDLQDTIEMLCDYKAVLYSTHSHTPDFPRFRLIIPLTRDVNPDEYVAVAKYVAAEWGMSMFDECSFRPAQLMYWPSCPKDGDYVFRVFDGEPLEPDRVLKAHPQWQNLAKAPVTREENKQKPHQADPLTKPGVVGAFCRCYTIAQAISVFLGGIYAPSELSGRYDYVPAQSTAGVVVYDDKFAYSHHATDPAYGMELNAFDLVRVHKFPNDDGKKSFDDMQAFAMGLPEVKKRIISDRLAQAADDFNEVVGGEAADGEATVEDWLTLLEIDKKGGFKSTPENFLTVLRHDEKLKGIAYNKMTSGISKRAPMPWSEVKKDWTDSDLAELWAYIINRYGMHSKEILKTAVMCAAAERAYHPIIEYFESLPPWDGIDRAEYLLIDYLGAEDNPYTRQVMLKTLQAAVERIYNPGVKFDTALILCGPQGCGKSMFFEKLGREWYSDNLTLMDMRDKSAAEKLQGAWILELGELAGMRKVEVESVKAFMTRTDDQYRPSYGTYVESHKRQSVVVGTTNSEDGFLRDITGNRRFWVVNVNKNCEKHPWDITDDDIDQIWAEIIERRRTEAVDLRLHGEAQELAEQAQATAMEHDERESMVETYLNTLLPEDWYERSIANRRRFIADNDELSAAGTVTRTKVCVREVWAECFGYDEAKLQRSDSYAITAILKNLGWKPAGALKIKGYGTVKTFKR